MYVMLAQCAGASAQCFSTGQCCNGLVCAVVDDVSGTCIDSADYLKTIYYCINNVLHFVYINRHNHL